MINTYEVLKPVTDNDGRIRKPGETVKLHDCQAFYLGLAGKVERAKKQTKCKRPKKAEGGSKSFTKSLQPST